jgi:UDP:flavonoid glycosyltransferase YjiC (YdhE family)
MTIAFVAPPFAGHFNPLFALALAARDAGYDAEFFTGPRKLPLVAAGGIRPVALQSIGDQTLESIANTPEPVGSSPTRLLAQFRRNLALLPAIHAELLQHWRSSPPSLIVADSVAPVAGFAAQQLGIPWITTIATPFSLECHSGTPSYCGGWGPATGPFTHTRNACGRLAVHAFKRAVWLLFRRHFLSLGLKQQYRRNGSESIYSPTAILGFGLRELEFPRDWPASFQMIGPVIEAPEPPSPLLLNQSRRSVLVTHGTHHLWSKTALVRDVIALSKRFPDVDFVVSLGDPTRAGHTGEQLSPRVRVLPFVSYSQHLPRFEAVIHHGGAGVTYAAILAAVPSLVIPRDYDQFDYAARIAHHRLGLRAPSLRGKAAEDAFAQLLDRRRWSPALETFQRYASAYRPKSAFLETLKRFSQSL